jgi:predicted 2-oxoglutarate/Fe(II)-dependent dioxygenase YbiX
MNNVNELSATAGVPLLLEPGFLDDDTCRQIRAAMDRGADGAAEVVGDAIARRETIRRARSVEIEAHVLGLIEDRIETIRTALERTFGRRLGDREGMGFLRYHTGGFYRPHRDRGEVAGWPAAARRSLAVVMFLNGGGKTSGTDSFEGGTLCLYPEGGRPPVEVHPATGLLAAFPADLLHEVRPVRAGTRDTAVDWFYDGTTG